MIRYKSVEERDALVKSLENDNSELVKIIQNYRQIENKKYPEISEDDWDDPKNHEIAAQLYWEHREALENIIEYSTKLKTSIENFLGYFTKSEEEKKFEEYIRKSTLEWKEKNKNGRK
jgi:hypothetical protein